MTGKITITLLWHFFGFFYPNPLLGVNKGPQGVLSRINRLIFKSNSSISTKVVCYYLHTRFLNYIRYRNVGTISPFRRNPPFPHKIAKNFLQFRKKHRNKLNGFLNGISGSVTLIYTRKENKKVHKTQIIVYNKYKSKISLEEKQNICQRF